MVINTILKMIKLRHRFSNLLKVTQLGSGRAGTQTEATSISLQDGVGLDEL